MRWVHRAGEWSHLHSDGSTVVTCRALAVRPPHDQAPTTMILRDVQLAMLKDFRETHGHLKQDNSSPVKITTRRQST